MTSTEIHSFGIEIVYNQIKKDGYEIISVNSQIDMNPQIVAYKDGILAFIEVRTDIYPKKGVLEEGIHAQIIEHAKKHDAIPYFASVGIANADAKTEDERSIVKRGGKFYISFEGLLIIANSDQIKILDKNRIRNISDNDPN